MKTFLTGVDDARDSDGEGQVTIPKPVRDFLGIVPGTRVVLTRADEKRPASRFSKLRGHAGKGLSTDAIMALMRGDE